MKKKLVVTISFILVVALLATLFAGCDEIFKKNETRDANQIVATVTYEGVSANVYKFELQSSFNSYAYLYVSYYGLSYEEATEYLLRSLAQQKLLGLYAKRVVLDYMKENHADKIDANLTYATVTSADLLSPAERNHAIEEVNESLLSSLKSIIKSAISEDNYNAGETTTETKEEVTDPVTVEFDSNDGSTVKSQEIQKGTKATAPTDPTKSGYTFYGWYASEDLSGDEFDFEATAIEEDTTLYAKWVEYLAPRTVKEEEEEHEHDFDPAEYVEEDEIAKFFSDEYQATLYDEIKDDDAVENMQVPTNKTYEETLKTYISEGLATLKKNLISLIHKADHIECYEYYLTSQCDGLLLEKLQNVIGKGVTVTKDEVEAEFALAVAKNKEVFGSSNTSYSSALTSALKTTYYHTSLEHSYGFVINILLKLDDDSVDALSERYTNQKNKEMVRLERNIAVSNMQVSVSNPDYDAEAELKVVDAENKEILIRDIMTDVRERLDAGTEDALTAKVAEYNAGNNYEQILSFEKVDGEYQIKYNAKEHPAMPYLVNKVNAFDKDGHTGIIHQIHNSFDQVKAAVEAGDLTHIEGVYWLREVATAWLYLVGDDSGALSSDANNGGLGYLITPVGETSSYLEDFTNYARNLIDVGTGAYQVGAVVDSDFVGADESGEIAGDGKAFVVADNVGSSSAYAGVFVLLASDKVWDANAYTFEDADGNELEDGEEQQVALGPDGVLPLNYVLTYAEDLEESKTAYDLIYDTLFSGKKSDEYNYRAAQVVSADNAIVYFEKVYKSLYEDLD